MESMANLKFALAMASRSANSADRLDVWLFQIDFFNRGFLPARHRAGGQFLFDRFHNRRRAEPPNLPLNFTPFQFHGLWLDVMITPPAAPRVFTAKEMAGVGV